VHPQCFIEATEAARETGGLVLRLVAVYLEGRVEVETSDPTRTPFVHVGMLSDRRDLVRIRQGLRYLFTLVKDGALAEAIQARRSSLHGEQKADRRARLQGTMTWMRPIVKRCAQYFHPVGTCRMGAREDPLAAVDSECRVIGTEALSVVDASIMPEIARCNTHATAIMIAEKAADILKGN
jgi:5-(hydroxymethyl)furfural/furfural oxidase